MIPGMDTKTFAAPLLQAYREHRAVTVAADAGPASREQAYATQRAIWQTLVGRARPTAWKVGAPTREAEPTAAPIFPQRLAASGATLPAASFLGLGIEAEIAVRFGHDLPPRATRYTRDEILDAIASVHVAIELIDTRLAAPKVAGPLWSLADNLVNGGLIVGDAIPHWRELDFAALTVRVSANGGLRAETQGRPPLDDLFFCLPWWIEHVGGAQAGDIVATGAWNGMHPVGLPVTVRVDFVGVGSAEARIG
ncbi:2-keto-4-pentenoate hydratase [Pseudogulbenkiania subflava DSM 22618]|uniref:2-keto-4-pentenoate hydratase n=2 Tax=Pseudogulbenkiania subflava TaxID=451637 RepID=A0A1Y6BCE9_9NEIS|nr:2-keto-4-pentenoate hydratase [Pseudogulbenkiania subflava DSM 22618]